MSSRTGLPTRLDFQANTEIALLDAYAMVQPGEAHDLIQANSDIEAAAIWLTTTATNLKTRRVMRKEVGAAHPRQAAVTDQRHGRERLCHFPGRSSAP